MFRLRSQRTAQREWISDYLHRMTYADAETIYNDWPALAGDKFIPKYIPNRPAMDTIIDILTELERRGECRRDLWRPERPAWLSIHVWKAAGRMDLFGR